MKARISHLHKTESEWLKLKDWVPEAGEFIIYDPDTRYSYARIKLGDGKTSLKELPFFIDLAIAAYIQNQRHQEEVDGGRVPQYKE